MCKWLLIATICGAIANVIVPGCWGTVAAIVFVVGAGMTEGDKI